MQYNEIGRHRRPGYADPSPYPEVKVTKQNTEYARLLMNDYAGEVSELTAINQYMYHHFVTQDEQARRMLENIALAEMLHMELLSELIKKLGGNPVYRNGTGQFWSAKNVYYGRSLHERINVDIDAEFKTIREYERHISLIEDPYVKAILQRIILDENYHVKLLNDWLRKNPGQ